jgi:uncharacterized protein (TIGR03083 family)
MTLSTVPTVNRSNERVAALAAENALLLDFLRGLSPEDWARPSACDRWSIADVVAHLIIAANLDRLPEALGGTPVVQPARPTEDEFRENLGAGAIALRKQLGAELLSTFEGKWAVFIGTLSRLQPEDWNLLAGHAMGSEPMPVWVDIRITEHAMHGWDIRSSFDPEATFLRTSLPALCNMAVRAVRRAFRPDPLRMRAIRYRFIVDAPHTVRHDLILSADGGRYQAPPEGKADVTLEADTATYLLVMYGRQPLHEAVQSSRMHVTGPAELVDMLERSFVGG